MLLDGRPLTPASIFRAARKASLLRDLLDRAGHPISTETARHVVARASGWLDWEELVSSMEAGGEPSPLDRALVGPDTRRGSLDAE